MNVSGRIASGLIILLAVVLWPVVMIIDVFEKRAIRKKYR